jgi:nuclease S1
MVIASIATRHLSPRARDAVAQLVPDQTLTDVANWADDIRSERPETERWHFVNIELADRRYDAARDCRRTSHGDCVIAATERFKHVLADPRRKQSERAEALRFLVHLIGDLHQPLHCSDNHDAGGNDVEVTFFGQQMNVHTQKQWNLHAVWDSGIIDRTGLSTASYAMRLQNALGAADLAALEGGSVVDWALEAQRAAADHAYKKLPANKRLGLAYFNENWAVVDDLLAKAGVRLARTLNDAFAR